MKTSQATTDLLRKTHQLIERLTEPGDFRQQLPEVLRLLAVHFDVDQAFFLATRRISAIPDQLVYESILEVRSGGTVITHQIPQLYEMLFSERVLKSWLYDLARIADASFRPDNSSTTRAVPDYICTRPDHPEARKKVLRNRVCQTLMTNLQSSFSSFLFVPVMYDEQVKGFIIFPSDEDRPWPASSIDMTVLLAKVLAKLLGVEATKDRELNKENITLKRSERRYRKLIRNCSAGIYYVKCGQPIPTHLLVAEQVDRYFAHAYLEECNEAFAAMSGFDDKNILLGQRVADLNTGKTHREKEELFLRLLETDYRINGMLTNERGANGERLLFVEEVFGIVENDHLLGLWGIRRKAKEARAGGTADGTEGAILTAIPDTKIKIRRDGIIVDTYGFSREKMGLQLRRETSQGKHLDQVLPVFVAQGLLFNVRKALDSGKLQTFEFFDSETGSEVTRYYEARINRVNDVEVIVILRNITKLKMAEKALTEQMHQVDQKNRQLQKYIESNLQLENFAYVASHDLREPVRTMRTFGQFLQRRATHLLDEESLSYLSFIIDGADRMNRLIEDLLTYSRVNTETTTDDAIELLPLLDEITTGLKVAIQETGAEIVYENLPPVLRGNRLNIQQLFQNLLANALKFHREGVPLKVTVSAKPTKTHWRFAVSDDGIGIEPEFHEQIFVIFKKLHNHQIYQGTGIGLTLVKRVVEQHGGEIWLTSQVGEGTTFYFTLLK